MATMGRGLHIITALGMHTVNPVSGDFSIGVDGHWIEGGKRVYPVRGVTIAGNILDLLSRVALVGADVRFYGTTGAPSLLVTNIAVGGT